MLKKRNNIAWAALSMFGVACSVFGIIAGIRHEKYWYLLLNVPCFFINSWYVYANVKRYVLAPPR